MVNHVIPAGAFFTHSPEICIRRPSAVKDIVAGADAWIEQYGGAGGEMNCQLRPGSDAERDGHLARFKGVERMQAMLLELKGKSDYSLIYHTMVGSCSFRYVEVNGSLRYYYRRRDR